MRMGKCSRRHCRICIRFGADGAGSVDALVGDEIVKEIVLVGFGGHAKSVIDSIEGMKAYKIAGYVDCADMPDYKGYTRIGK